MAKAKGKKRKIGAGDVASNRYASYRYELIERIECGIALQGTEVKALRASGAQLKDGYAAIRDPPSHPTGHGRGAGGELWLHSVHIPPYLPASRENHDPERARKLLLHRSELDRIAALVSERGLTLVPTRIYFSGPHAKVEIALARGKDLYDKRQTLRERESKRDMERGLREARR
jgi:SsrA-binding protein